jgi:lysophospholipase L1-like esterase
MALPAALLALLFLPMVPPAGQAAAPDCPPVPVQVLSLPAWHAAVRGAGDTAVLETHPLTVVALGSSSTAGAGASGPEATYPARLEAALLAALPDAPLRVVNRGVNGEDAAQMAARLEQDVLAERPALVIWQVGANGALRRADPQRFRAIVVAGIARLRQAGAEVVLMDNQRAPKIEAAPGHEHFDGELAGLAEAPGVALFSRRRLMRAWAAAGAPPAAMLTGDGLHHNDRGYACLATALAKALLAEPH